MDGPGHSQITDDVSSWRDAAMTIVVAAVLGERSARPNIRMIMVDRFAVRNLNPVLRISKIASGWCCSVEIARAGLQRTE